MAQSSQIDALQYNKLDFSYNTIESELSDSPRFVAGNNSLVTSGGRLEKRNGTLFLNDTDIGQRCERLWLYETLETPVKYFILGSFFNTGTSQYELKYFRVGTSTDWTSIGSLRSAQASIYPHEVVISRGLAYVTSFPDPAAGDKLGTTIFDGSGGSPTQKNWGLLGPTTPVAISGRVTRLSASITAAATTINVVANFSPSVTAPFNIIIDFEEMTVTSTGGGTNWTATRAINGTTASTHDDDSIVIYKDWSASTHRVDVNRYWSYSYALKTNTNHISNRSPIENNPDKLPSLTGPFQDLVPKLTYTGDASTTNVPKIIMYRTTDGGGIHFRLEEFSNPGSGSQTYLDDSQESGSGGGTFNDPLPDKRLDQGNLAPSLTSNSPPPTVEAPLIVGTDAPVRSSPLAAYVGRLWKGVGHTLFYSALEEIQEGVPEESWPSGIAGNFFKFQFPVLNLLATNNALFIFTTQATYVLTGTNQETFTIRVLYEDIGHPSGHPAAVAKFGGNVSFLTHDFRICMVRSQSPETPIFVSDPLGTDIETSVLTDGAEIDIKYFGDKEDEWLIISAHVKATTTLSKQWVYDINKSRIKDREFWNTPWTIRSTASISGRISATQPRRMLWFIWNHSTSQGGLAYLDASGTTAVDAAPNGTSTGTTATYSLDIKTHLMTIPPGNHVNSLRIPALNPSVHYIIIERKKFASDNDPTIDYYKDDLWTTPVTTSGLTVDVTRRDVSIGYKTIVIPLNEVAHRFALRIQKTSSTERFECLGYTIGWNPEGGVGVP